MVSERLLATYSPASVSVSPYLAQSKRVPFAKGISCADVVKLVRGLPLLDGKDVADVWLSAEVVEVVR